MKACVYALRLPFLAALLISGVSATGADAQTDQLPCETSAEECEACRSDHASLPADRIEFYCGSANGERQFPDELAELSLSALLDTALGQGIMDESCDTFKDRLLALSRDELTDSRPDLAFAEVAAMCNADDFNVLRPDVALGADGSLEIAAVQNVLELSNKVSGVIETLDQQISTLDVCRPAEEGQVSVIDLEESWNDSREEAERFVSCNLWFDFVASCQMDIPVGADELDSEIAQLGDPEDYDARQKRIAAIGAYRNWLTWWADESPSLDSSFREIRERQEDLEGLRFVSGCT